VALRRSGWIWGPAAAAVLVAVLLLPAGGETGRSFLSFLQGSVGSEHNETYRDDVKRALDVQRARLRDAERADSLLAAVGGPRALHSRDRVTVVYETPLTVAAAGAWMTAAEGELGRYPAAAGPGGSLVIALYSNPARARSREFGLWYWMARRLPPDFLRSSCIVEVNLVPHGPRDRSRAASPRSIGPFLGLCGLYQRFGEPGSEITQWMIRRGWRTYGLADGGWMAKLSEAGRAVPRIEIQRPDLSNDRPWEWYWGTPWVAIGCLDGSWSLCERNVRIRPGDYYWWWYSDSHQSQLLAFLLASGTPAQFAAFWRSPLGVGDALRQAYGRPAGQLAHDALNHWYSTAPGGPRAGPRLMLAGAFWAAAALALALVAGRRWTTEI